MLLGRLDSCWAKIVRRQPSWARLPCSVTLALVQGARHVGKDIAGKGLANPCAALLSTAMMLRHLNLPDFCDRCCCLSPYWPAMLTG